MNKYKVFIPESFHSVWNVEANTLKEARDIASNDRKEYLSKYDYVSFGPFRKGHKPKDDLDTTLAESFKELLNKEIKYNRDATAINIKGKYAIVITIGSLFPKIMTTIYFAVFAQQPKVNIFVHESDPNCMVFEFDNIHF